LLSSMLVNLHLASFGLLNVCAFVLLVVDKCVFIVLIDDECICPNDG